MPRAPHKIFSLNNDVKMSDQELADHFEKMTKAQEQRRVDMEYQASIMSDDSLTELSYIVGFSPRTETDKHLRAIIDREFETRPKLSTERSVALIE